jgi:ATP phosphoribosyltransferase
LLPKLGYGGARLVVAVPRVWIDVASMADLEEVALIYRQRRGRCLRVATKFPRLTRAFFAEHGIADYMIVQSGGATEGAPASGVADIIVDLSSTGATLAQNHLKEISGGTLVDSQACLIASTRSTDWDGEALHALRQVVEMIEGRLRAKSSKVVQFSALRSQAARIAAELEVRFHCEAHDGARAAWGQTYGSPAADAPVAVTAICPSPALYSVILYLREAGCLEITTSRPDFIFSKPSEAVEGFRKLLRHLHEDQKSPLNTGGG